MDLFRFFGKAFVPALKDWKVGSEEELRAIQEMKDQRGNFQGIDEREKLYYSRAECFRVPHGGDGDHSGPSPRRRRPEAEDVLRSRVFDRERHARQDAREGEHCQDPGNKMKRISGYGLLRRGGSSIPW